MQKEKYCPKCLELVDGKTEKCPKCGYEFVKVIEEDEEVTNHKIFDDPTPAFVWKAIGFIFPPAAIILYFVWREMWPQRVKDAAKNAISMSIFWGVVLILYVLYLIFKSKGLIV